MKASWGARDDDVEGDASRISEWASAIGALDPTLFVWNRGGAREPEIVDPVGNGIGWVTLLRDGTIGNGLGSVISAWSGDAEAGFGLTVHCGSVNPAVSNQLVLQIPNQHLELISNRDDAATLIEVTALGWNPDYATLLNTDLWSGLTPDADGFIEGWLTYLPFESARLGGADIARERIRTVANIGHVFAMARSYSDLNMGLIAERLRPT